jgi:hypothetical protein
VNHGCRGKRPEQLARLKRQELSGARETDGSLVGEAQPVVRQDREHTPRYGALCADGTRAARC